MPILLAHRQHGRWHGAPLKVDGKPDAKRSRHEIEHEGPSQGHVPRSERHNEEQAGQVIKNSSLVREGQAEKGAGKIQKKVGQVEKVFGK